MATKKKKAVKRSVKKPAAKKAAPKKKPAKKAAPKKQNKIAVRRVRPSERGGLVNTLGRRTSNRVTLRAISAGRPPEGAVDAKAMEAAILAWMAIKNRSNADYAQYPLPRLMADAREMAQGREDLPLFAELETPITERDFDWLDLLFSEMVRLGDDERVNDADREVLREDVQIAVRDVAEARTTLSQWGQAVGVPLSLFAADRDPEDPYAVFNSATSATAMFRLYLDQMGGVTHPARLLARMEEALGKLAPFVGVKREVVVDTLHISSRRAAVKRLLLDCLLYIAPWGRAVVGNDPTKKGRYELDRLFPKRRKKAAPPQDQPV